MAFQGVLLRLAGPLRRAGQDRSGATAVEFALIGAPFVLTLMALAEVAVIGLVQSNLDLAMTETARRIRTGEIQQAGLTAADIRNEVCSSMGRILPVDCGGDLFVDVRRFDAFTEVADGDPADDGLIEEAEMAFDPGDPSDIVLVRGFYQHQVFTPFFQDIFGNIDGGQRVMYSAFLFRNEPWPDGS
ncbi:MAG: pilus assembly protein [Alphaproteobacteria bacterium]|jgi:Flp pilus assembly protein TadG|nr:pilus assembly protein [Alphaproteobacteria bacterium]